MKYLLRILMPILIFCSCSKNDGMAEIRPTVESGINFWIIVGSKTFTGIFYTTAAADAFRAALPFTVTMSDMNNNEKYCDLPQKLPASSTYNGTINSGDLMLYSSQTLVLFYKTFSSSYSYTRIGRIDNPIGLEAALEGANVSVRFEQTLQATQYRLTYNSNGATSGTTPAEITANRGSNITLNNGFGLSRSGYSFASWNTNANGKGIDYSASSSYVINSNATLYAKWQIVTNNSNAMKITVGNTTFTATLTTNATATAFKAMLPLTLNMSDFNNNEKVSSLPKSLITSALNPETIHIGDIMLYGSNSLVLFYKTFSTPYSYTRIGQIDDVSGVKAALGSGSVYIKFELIS